MELDGITKVFTIGDAGKSAWMMHPTKVKHEQRLMGSEAQAVFDRCDIRAVSILGEGTQEFSCTDLRTMERFTFDYSDKSWLERHQLLAVFIQQRYGATGFTIIVY